MKLPSAASARPEEVVRIAANRVRSRYVFFCNWEGVPLRPAILHTDMSSDEEVVRINGLFPEIHQGHSYSQLIWVRDLRTLCILFGEFRWASIHSLYSS